MTDDPQVPRAQRARAVADAPLDAVVADAAGIARRWAIALINQRPLERIGELPLEAFAEKAPPLCALIVRSLGSDAELERLTAARSAGGREDSVPVRTLRALAGARSAPAAVEAVEALRGVLWEALLGELHWPVADRSPPRLLVDLADRLAYVCATVLAASLAHDPAGVSDQFEVVTPSSAAAANEFDRPSRHARVVLIDERPDTPARHAAETPTAPVHGLEDRVGERGRSRGAGERGQAAQRTASSAHSSDRVPAIDRPDESSTAAMPPTRPRPLPWDTPLRADRADQSAGASREGSTTEDGEQAEGESGVAGHPVIRVTRRTTPVDGAA